MTIRVLCGKKFPIKLKYNKYQVANKPILLYRTERWFVKKIHEENMKVLDVNAEVDVR